MNTNACYQIYGYGRLDKRWLRSFEGHTIVYLDNGKTGCAANNSNKFMWAGSSESGSGA